VARACASPRLPSDRVAREGLGGLLFRGRRPRAVRCSLRRLDSLRALRRPPLRPSACAGSARPPKATRSCSSRPSGSPTGPGGWSTFTLLRRGLDTRASTGRWRSALRRVGLWRTRRTLPPLPRWGAGTSAISRWRQLSHPHVGTADWARGGRRRRDTRDEVVPRSWGRRWSPRRWALRVFERRLRSCLAAGDRARERISRSRTSPAPKSSALRHAELGHRRRQRHGGGGNAAAGRNEWSMLGSLRDMRQRWRAPARAT